MAGIFGEFDTGRPHGATDAAAFLLLLLLLLRLAGTLGISRVSGSRLGLSPESLFHKSSYSEEGGRREIGGALSKGNTVTILRRTRLCHKLPLTDLSSESCDIVVGPVRRSVAPSRRATIHSSAHLKILFTGVIC